MYFKPDEKVDGIAYTYADQESLFNYNPLASYTYNASDGDVEITSFVVGDYDVEFEGFGAQGISSAEGHVQVTAVGSSGSLCKPVGQAPSVVDVNCTDTAGTAADSEYNILYLRPVNVPEPTLGWGIASGGALIAILKRRRRPV